MITPEKRGNNGIRGLRDVIHPTQCAYCYLRFSHTSLRTPKYVLIFWAPSSCEGRQRAETSANKGVLKAVLSLYSAELLATELADLEEDNIVSKLHGLGLR
jgi:hypothetical protein